MLDKIIEIIMTILPFLGNRKKRKAMAQNVKEFSELVKDQYTFLMEQLEKLPPKAQERIGYMIEGALVLAQSRENPPQPGKSA